VATVVWSVTMLKKFIFHKITSKFGVTGTVRNKRLRCFDPTDQIFDVLIRPKKPVLIFASPGQQIVFNCANCSLVPATGTVGGLITPFGFFDTGVE
jgi:hypothetical protein